MAETERFLTKREFVAGAIRRQILNATLKPGTQLQQDEIAARLGVSPTPVREAFGLLEAEGFLENRPHRGVFVTSPDYQDMIDIYEVRTLLEGLAIRKIGDRTQLLAGRLLAVTDRAAKELDEGNVELIRRTNNDFHQMVIEDANSRTLSEVSGKLIVRSLFFFPFDVEYFRSVNADHVAIAAALKAGHVEGSIELLTEHHRKNIERLRAAKADPQTVTSKSLLSV